MHERNTKGIYGWDAEDYSKSSSMQKKWGRELLSKLPLNGEERVLDIGCGDGALTFEIAARLPRGYVLGIDNSPEMIAFARRSYPPSLYSNLGWEVVDARELPFESQFDVVFSNAVLHWIADHLPVLEGIRKSLKPGGRIMLEMGGRGNASEVAMALVETITKAEWKDYFNDFNFNYSFYGPEEYEPWLRQVGLIPKRVELIPKDMVHRGREGLAAWIRTTWLPFTQRIPHELRDAFVYQMVERYMENHPPDEKGLVHVQAVRLEVEAERPT